MYNIRIDYKKLIEVFKEVKLTSKTAKIMNCSIATVHNILKKNNIQTPKKGEFCRKYTCNFSFFKNIDTENKAYWLGFMMADAYISKDTRIVLALAKKDREHIITFNTHINSNHNIGDYTINSGKFKGKEYSKINISSKEMLDDLISHGCVNKKSLILKFPNTIPKNLIHHFIRGYFDGDGSVFTVNERHWRGKSIKEIIFISIVGTKEFLTSMYNITKIGSDKSIKLSKSYIKNNTFTYRVKRYNKCKEFYEYMYKDATVYLERKKEVFDEYFRNNVQRS